MKPLLDSRAIWRRLLLAATLGASTATPPARAVDQPNRVTIAYVAPTNKAHQPIIEMLKQHRVLERFKVYLSPLRLPHVLSLRTAGCDGDADAWYDEDERRVTVCYEYIAEALANAPKQTTADGMTPQDAVLGPVIEVFLHEIGHAVFNLLRVPVLGHEEDAADQVAAYMMLQLDRDLARRTIAAVVRMYAQETAKATTPDKSDFADVHGLPGQRLYTLMCLAYGADPKLFGDLVTQGHLPEDRAEGCEAEYAQVGYAFHRLIEPHVDQAMRRTVHPKRALGSLATPATAR